MTNAVNVQSLTPTVYYMRGRDADCGTLTYRYWSVSGSPDWTGSGYTGIKCGATPLADIVLLRKS